MARKRVNLGGWLLSTLLVLASTAAVFGVEWGALTSHRRFMLLVVLGMVAAFGALLVLSFVVDRDR